MLRHLSPESFNKLLIILISSQRPLVDLQCQALLFALQACDLSQKNVETIAMFLFGFGVGTVLLYFN